MTTSDPKVTHPWTDEDARVLRGVADALAEPHAVRFAAEHALIEIDRQRSEIEALRRSATGATADCTRFAGRIEDLEEDLEKALAQERSARTDMESGLRFYKEREAHFAEVLRVADGGQYRNDWDAPIRRVLTERNAAQAEVERLHEENARLRATAPSSSGSSPDPDDEHEQCWEGISDREGLMPCVHERIPPEATGPFHNAREPGPCRCGAEGPPWRHRDGCHYD
jgi:hypothetical protein